MADIAQGLMIKYGLRGNPSQTLVDQWVDATEAFIRQGMGTEAAGRQAAAAIFPSFETCVYASEADTITSLLGRARDKN